LALGLLVSLALGPAFAQSEAAEPPKAAPAEPLENSSLDAPLFYQILIGEMEATEGRQGNAFELLLEAATRAKDGALFQRAIELAKQGRSGERALAACEAWRKALPDSREAVVTQVQLLAALDRLDELPEPLRRLIAQVEPAERSELIAGLPRFLASASDKRKAFEVGERSLSSALAAKETRTASRTALGRLALAAEQPEKALALMQQASQDDPSAPGPVLLALDLMSTSLAAEPSVQNYLARPDALPGLRFAYAQVLDQRQRVGEAVVQLRLALSAQPDTLPAWLTLGAFLVDLQEPEEAIKALNRYLQSSDASPGEAPAASSDEEDRDDRRQQRIDLAWSLMSQAEAQRGHTEEALKWLDKVEASRMDLGGLTRRALLMVRQGRLSEARTLVREGSARGEPNAKARLLAESQVLREAKRWKEAYDLLLAGLRATPDDTTVIYEMAMMAEKLSRHDDMEALLRRVMALKPDDAQAYNALGYSFAERGVRLDEALALVQHATSLAPDDPFIADSLGWVAYKRGELEPALKLLQRSNAARPHVEVAAHLGEVLWALQRRDEAQKVWREGRGREQDNEVLLETLRRLKVKL
jgi:tetratricopeptide (TPR) repeat protein